MRHGQPCRYIVLRGTSGSQNRVGYQNKDVSRLLSNQICTFEKIGEEGSNITEFKPVDEDGNVLSDAVTVQFYSDRGKLLEQYTYTLGADIDEGYEDGWYDDDQESTHSKDIPFGQGFKVYTTESSAKLLYAGEVDTSAVAIPISRLLSSMGNFRPMPIELKNLTVVDENDEPVSDAVTIQFYSDRGKLLEQYTYTLGADIDEGYEDGWYDDDQETTHNKTIEAGQGFCIYTTESSAFLKFPAIGGK